MPVPSLFFIGENGVPLEIVAGSTTAADLLIKLDLVLTKARTNKNSSTNLIDAEKKDIAACSTDNNPNTTTSVELESGSTSTSNTEVSLTQTPVEDESKDSIADDTKVEPSTSLKSTEAPKPSDETKDAPTKELTQEVRLQHNFF